MDTATSRGPVFSWTGVCFPVPGRGMNYTATLQEDCARSDLENLIKQDVALPGGLKATVCGVESYAIPRLRAGMSIGVLVGPARAGVKR